MKENIKKYSSFIIVIGMFVLSQIAEIVFDKVFHTAISVHLKTLIFITSISCLITYWISEHHFEIMEKEIRKELINQKDEFDKALSKKNDTIHNLKEKTINDKGLKLLNTALCVGLYNPVRYHLFEKAAKEHNNVHAALLIAFTYIDGINGQIGKDYDKANDILMTVADYDCSGAVYWALGWIQEHNYISGASKEKALEYYEKSRNMGYPKAYNSMANFNQKGWGGVERDSAKMIHDYTEAADNDDAYGMLNLAYCMEKDNKILDAETYFIKACDNHIPIARARLARLYIDNFYYFSKHNSTITTQRIADMLIDSIKDKGLTSLEKAFAYYWLAKVISMDDSVDVSKLIPNENAQTVCLIESYRKINKEINDKRNKIDVSDEKYHDIHKLLGSTAGEIWLSLQDHIKININ